MTQAQDPRTIPAFTTRLWSEEVGLASGGGPDEELPHYEFNNGRRFTRRYPYDNTPALPAPGEE